MSKLSDRLLALLFTASEPVTAVQLAAALDIAANDAASELATLTSSLAGGPLRLTYHHDRYRLVTAPEYSDDIRRFLVAEAKTELSRPAMETLAIIAYQGPVTKAAIDQLRGVASDTMLRNLLQRNLIVEQGTADEPGHPQLYAVSHTFLGQVGLTSLAELPPLPNVETNSNEA
jgi:segregation and condensation protein B